MNAREYASRYAEAQVSSADPQRLLLLVFEGGTKFLRLCRTALAQGDLAGFGVHLGRAQAIISELLNTLDYEAGGQIAKDLGRLYDFMLFHLTEANAKKSLRHVEEVIAIFDTIADAYRQILVPAGARPAAAPTAP